MRGGRPRPADRRPQIVAPNLASVHRIRIWRLALGCSVALAACAPQPVPAAPLAPRLVSVTPTAAGFSRPRRVGGSGMLAAGTSPTASTAACCASWGATAAAGMARIAPRNAADHPHRIAGSIAACAVVTGQTLGRTRRRVGATALQ